MLEGPGVVLYSEVCIRISCPGGVSAIPVHRDCSSLERNVTIPATSPMTMSHFLFRAVVMVVWFLKKAIHSSSSPEQNVSSQTDIAVGIESVGESLADVAAPLGAISGVRNFPDSCQP